MNEKIQKAIIEKLAAENVNKELKEVLGKASLGELAILSGVFETK